MTDKQPFKVDLVGLKSRAKEESPQAVEQVERAGEELGFVDRSPPKKRGRPKSERTGQVHAKVLPHVQREIAEEARRRGVQQGVLIEEAWALYQKDKA
jgi:hypothetical protein